MRPVAIAAKPARFLPRSAAEFLNPPLVAVERTDEFLAANTRSLEQAHNEFDS